MNTVYLLLGSNEGERMEWLQKATNSLNERAGHILRVSNIYETAAWGLQEQPDFLNMVLELETELSAQELLERIQEIEAECGRRRATQWGQRTLDIDILFYNDEMILTESLTVPHPYLHDRRFTLAPLQEIAGALVHPVFHKTVTELLETCKDDSEVRRHLTMERS